DVAEVVRHFVDEEWLSMTVSTRVRDVTLAERAEVFRRKFGQNSRISMIITPPQLKHSALDVGEFARPFDEGGGIENLAGGRRSRARQPDNENRVGVRHADSYPCGEKLRRADLNLLGCVRFDEERIVAAFGALQCIAALVELP